MGCIQSSANKANGTRAQAYRAATAADAGSCQDAHANGAQPSMQNRQNAIPAQHSPQQAEADLSMATGSTGQPAPSAALEQPRSSPQIGTPPNPSPTPSGPLVATPIMQVPESQRGGTSSEQQSVRLSMPDLPMPSQSHNTRVDNSLALLQKVLPTGVSDAAVHTQAWGLKHIGFGPLKKENQDEFYMQTGDFGGQPHGNCYCVFDGHGVHGAGVSAYCLRELPKILDAALRKYNEQEAAGSANQLRMMEDIKAVIKQSFVTTEKNLRESGLNISSSGTTASVVLQLGAQVWVAAVGDSRVILMRKLANKIVAQPLTLDHRPSRNSEKARVVAAGGRVEPKKLPTGRTVGEDRLWLQDIPTPGLLLSRSIGDDMASSIGCTAEPEVTFMRLQPHVDISLIMATDGIWDVLGNDQVCQLVSQADSSEDACDQLLDKALEVWEDRLAADNISVVVIKYLWNDDGIGTF